MYANNFKFTTADLPASVNRMQLIEEIKALSTEEIALSTIVDDDGQRLFFVHVPEGITRAAVQAVIDAHVPEVEEQEAVDNKQLAVDVQRLKKVFAELIKIPAVRQAIKDIATS